MQERRKGSRHNISFPIRVKWKDENGREITQEGLTENVGPRTSTLPETFLGKLLELDYKTIRYAGHCEKFKMMIDLGLCSSEKMSVDDAKVTPRKVFGELLQKDLPADEADYVLIRLELVGTKDGEKKRLRYDIVDKLEKRLI